MATLTKDYSTPSDICWVDGDVDSSATSASTASRKAVREGGSAFKISWVCPHYTYQLQYRVKRRLSPAYAGAGGEVWEGWGEWQGHDLSDVKSDTERLQWGNLNVTSASFYFPYDFSQYDRIEYQVRVRAFDEATYKCSDWGYGELTVLYEPVIRNASATRRPNGDVVLAIDTNWVRGGNRFMMKNIRRDRENGVVVPKTVAAIGLEPDFTVIVPHDVAGESTTIYANLQTFTSDGVMSAYREKSFTVDELDDPESIEEPTVVVEDMEPHAFVKVVSETDRYDSVFVTASYTDVFGSQQIIEAEVIDGGFMWAGYIDSPPYDIPVTYRVAVVNEAGWTSKTVEHVTPSKGRCSWSSGDDVVSLVFDINTAATFSSNVETVDTADGGTAVRFGKGGSRTLSASGNLLRKHAGEGTWKPELEALRQKRVWAYRKPGGEKYSVIINSISESESNDKAVSVSVSMTEVS